jgi:hypothetical protein
MVDAIEGSHLHVFEENRGSNAESYLDNIIIRFASEPHGGALTSTLHDRQRLGRDM